MPSYRKPYLIELSRIGQPSIGYITVAEYQSLPFEVKRVFWTYFTPESIVRGRHAHYKTEQVLFAVSGRIIVTTELASGEISVFPLEKPNIGVYIPPNAWHTMQYSHTAVQLVLTSQPYDENDYIRDYEKFKQVWGEK